MAWRAANVTICTLRLAKNESGCDHERISLVVNERGEGGLYLATVARVRDLDLYIEGGSRHCAIFGESLSGRLIRIHQRTKASSGWKKIAQQAKSLCHQFAHKIVHAGCVAARPIEAGDETEFDRVVGDIEDDGSPTARGDRRAPCTGIGPGDNDRRLSSDEISGQQWEPVVLPLSIAILNCYVAVFDVARFGQGLDKCRQIRRGRS